jgi:putative spermidine/putrescine transport system permease protein
MSLPVGLRRALAVIMVVALAILYIPLLLVVLNSFNASRTFGFPPTGFTLEWWQKAANSSGALSSLGTSVLAGVCAMLIALVLGSMAAFAVQRFRFFGRSTISFLVVLPITLPGIVTGIALNASFLSVGVQFGIATVIVGHATFCIVIVFNNVQARLRRMGSSLEEASADLGANGWQTFSPPDRTFRHFRSGSSRTCSDRIRRPSSMSLPRCSSSSPSSRSGSRSDYPATRCRRGSRGSG